MLIGWKLNKLVNFSISLTSSHSCRSKKCVQYLSGAQLTNGPQFVQSFVMENKPVEKASRTQTKRHFNPQQRVRSLPKSTRRPNDIYITTKSNFKAQQKQCEDLLSSGVKEIYLHCLGNAINRGLNLTLNLVNNSNNALSYVINTSTFQKIDHSHPLYDEDDVSIQQRNISAIHIRISRNIHLDIDSE